MILSSQPPPNHVHSFDRKANCYQLHSHIQEDTAAWVAHWLPSGIEEGNCLELGAGTGNFTQHLLKVFPNVNASDNAPNMVHTGRDNFPRARWTLQDAWHPDLPPHSQSYLASCSLLQWAPDPVAVLKNWKTLLQPGGRHLSGIYISPSLTELASLLPEEYQFHWRSAEEWQSAFHDAGFKIIRSESTTRRYRYPDAITLFRRLHGTGTTPIQSPLPFARFRRLLQEYEATFSCDRGVSTTWTFFRIETAI